MDFSGSILYSMPAFQNFFSNIDQSKLDGFHSSIYQKIRKALHSITYEEAKNIFIKLNQKNSYKNKKNWKQQEVILFLYVVDKASIKFELQFQDFNDQIWNKISQLIPGRTGDACKIKMISLVPANLNNSPWTEAEQQMLAEIIEIQGSNKWKTVSLKLYERNPTKIYRSSKQCRQRYMCFLKPNLKKGFWNENEDYQLIMLFLKYGRKWSKMTQFIQGRNQNAIKNRFFLLFQESSKNQKLYYSEFMRKVMRRKQKLQKILGVKDKSQQNVIEQKNRNSYDNFLDGVQQNILKIKSERESSSTERDYKSQEIAEIQKFFTF